MNVPRRRVAVGPHAVQPALPLGHADVLWDALPRTVQDDVLARWCELLSAVITTDAPAATAPECDEDTRETRP